MPIRTPIPGGKVRIGLSGAFDSLNPFNLKSGSTAQGINGNVFQSLLARSNDEPFTLYGLVARSVETDDSREHVTFRLDPRAHFSDGAPLTSADVLFSFDLLRTKGRPQQRVAYGLVKRAEAPDAQTVTFDLTGVEGPRIAADPRPDAGAARACDRCRAFHRRLLEAARSARVLM